MNEKRAARVEDVLITAELSQRRSRVPDERAEREALHVIAAELTSGPERLLGTLVRLGLELCRAHTAGLSVLYTRPDGEQYFRWDAMAGTLAAAVGGTTPRGWSPCGTTLDRRSAQLFYYPHRFFTYFAEVQPLIVEGLVVPVYVNGRALGTLWIVGHDEERKFDREDIRMMTSLASFCGAALHLCEMRSQDARRAS